MTRSSDFRPSPNPRPGPSKRYHSERDFDDRGRRIREAADEAVGRALASLEADFVLHFQALDAYCDDLPIREWSSHLLARSLMERAPEVFDQHVNRADRGRR